MIGVLPSRLKSNANAMTPMSALERTTLSPRTLCVFSHVAQRTGARSLDSQFAGGAGDCKSVRWASLLTDLVSNLRYRVGLEFQP